MSYKSFVYDLPYDRQEQPFVDGSQITIGLFFDGTCNNRFNVEDNLQISTYNVL